MNYEDGRLPEIFVYDDAYLRICQSPYDLERLDETSRHLSNYSLNKSPELVMSTKEFISRLDNKDISW